MKQMSDKEFVESVIMQRMELCYSRWKDGKSSDKKDDYDEIEKAYEKAIFLKNISIPCLMIPLKNRSSFIVRESETVITCIVKL